MEIYFFEELGILQKKNHPIDQYLEIIDTLSEASECILNYAYNQNYNQLEFVVTNMIVTVTTLYDYLKELNVEIPFLSASASCKNIEHSLNNISKLARARSIQILNKIEFELIPIIDDFYYDLYFFTRIYGNKEKEKQHFRNEYLQMVANPYIDASLEKNEFKYEVSIAVIAYNKLDYTKLCVESILKYTPNYINYELILVNNGSTDGTQEYFESISPTKLFSLKVNSLQIMNGAVPRLFEGKYQLVISNDVIVTENYLDNLIKCMESDPHIGMIVPTTPNTSNLQGIDANYSSLEEMHIFAKNNNVSDPTKWEERVRLCNPLMFIRGEAYNSSRGVGSTDKYFVYSEFGDDALSLRMRRAGYKLILAKDCFCHHFGSVTLGDNRVHKDTLGKSRQLFLNRYSVDAWNLSACYDPLLFANLNIIKNFEKVDILGINSGYGSNPLKIKEYYKSLGQNNVSLKYYTDDESFYDDLNSIGDKVWRAEDELLFSLKNMKFDYIVIENNINHFIKCEYEINKLRNSLKQNGILAILTKDSNLNQLMLSCNPTQSIEGVNYSWFLWNDR